VIGEFLSINRYRTEAMLEEEEQEAQQQQLKQ
jgi:hypothetical protein